MGSLAPTPGGLSSPIRFLLSPGWESSTQQRLNRFPRQMKNLDAAFFFSLFFFTSTSCGFFAVSQIPRTLGDSGHHAAILTFLWFYFMCFSLRPSGALYFDAEFSETLSFFIIVFFPVLVERFQNLVFLHVSGINVSFF